MSLTGIKYDKVSAGDVERRRFEGITGAAGSAGSAAEQVNQEELANKIRRLEQAFPTFTKGVGEAYRLARDWVAGKPSKGFEEQMGRRAAERGISMGMPGSQFSGFGELATYGRAVEDLQRQGLAAMQQVGAQIQSIVGDPWKPSTGFQSSAQALSFAQGERDAATAVASYNAGLLQQQEAAAREEETMNRIGRISGRNAAQGMSFSSPSRGSGNPYAGRGLADRLMERGSALSGGTYSLAGMAQSYQSGGYGVTGRKRHSIYGYSQPYYAGGFSNPYTTTPLPPHSGFTGSLQPNLGTGFPAGGLINPKTGLPIQPSA